MASTSAVVNADVLVRSSAPSFLNVSHLMYVQVYDDNLQLYREYAAAPWVGILSFNQIHLTY